MSLVLAPKAAAVQYAKQKQLLRRWLLTKTWHGLGFYNGAGSCVFFVLRFVGEESGAGNVHPMTLKLSKMRESNSSRDIFRFISLPISFSYVECPYKVDPNGPEVIQTLLPMIDPHELLDYLWRTGRVQTSPADLASLSND